MPTTPLDEIIRRFDEGDRSPAVLGALDRAAWTCWHDPWETRPDFRVAPEEPGPWDTAAGAIRGLLEALRWKYEQEDRCAFACVPPHQAWTGLEPLLRFEEAGNGDLVFRLILGAPFAGEDLRALARLSAAWTWSGRRPRPELDPAPPETGGEWPLFSNLRLEDRIPLPASGRAVEQWVKRCMVEAHRFLELAGTPGKA